MKIHYKHRKISLVPAILALLVLFIGHFHPFSGYPTENARALAAQAEKRTIPEQTALVQVTPVRKGPIAETVVAYGTVVPAPGRAKTLSIPFEIQVNSVYVTEGQEVSKGDRLLEVAPSPDTVLNMQTAMIRYKAARKRLQETRERIDLKLATSDELLRAEQALEEAESRLKSLQNRRIAKRVIIRSRSDGVVSRLLVARGAIVPAGTPVMKIVAGDAAEVRLGVEPEDVNIVRPGRRVSLAAVNRPALPPVNGKVRAVSRRVNPSTRLLDVFVTIPSPPSLMLNEYVKAKITTVSRKALLVPRLAVLPEGDHFTVFTIKGGRARKHTVHVGMETDREVEISGGGVTCGDQVVILGNYELEDGMAVRVRSH